MHGRNKNDETKYGDGKITKCPECGNGSIEVDDANCKDDGQGYRWVTTYSCSCNECGCIFDKIETVEISYEIDKHGVQYDKEN